MSCSYLPIPSACNLPISYRRTLFCTLIIRCVFFSPLSLTSGSRLAASESSLHPINFVFFFFYYYLVLQRGEGAGEGDYAAGWRTMFWAPCPGAIWDGDASQESGCEGSGATGLRCAQWHQGGVGGCRVGESFAMGTAVSRRGFPLHS